MRRGDVSSTPSRCAEAYICSPSGFAAGKTKPCRCLTLPEDGEQLKRARKGCIGAPAGLPRRQSALHV